jgi:hypothetical protein
MSTRSTKSSESHFRRIESDTEADTTEPLFEYQSLPYGDGGGKKIILLSKRLRLADDLYGQRPVDGRNRLAKYPTELVERSWPISRTGRIWSRANLS